MATLFGGNYGTAFLATLVGFTTGLSMIVHGLSELLNALGPVNSGLEAVLTSIATVIDSINALLIVATSIDSFAGVEGIAAQLFVQAGVLVTGFNSLQNLRTDVDNITQENASCADLAGSCRIP